MALHATMRRLFVTTALALPLLLQTANARAEGTALRADLVEPKAIKLDGVTKEWTQMARLDKALEGIALRKAGLATRAPPSPTTDHTSTSPPTSPTTSSAPARDHVQVVHRLPRAA